MATSLPSRAARRTLSQRDAIRLGLLVLRCRLLRHDRQRAQKKGVARRAFGVLHDNGDVLVEHIYRALFLASVHVLVENWDKSFAYDERAARLLKVKGHREAVHEYRNSVFHDDPMIDPKNVRSRGRLHELIAWADEVLDAIDSHVREAF